MLSLMIASVSYTIATTGIFKWLREKVSKISDSADTLIHCPYCLAHWIIWPFLLNVHRSDIFPVVNDYQIDLLITWFAIMALVALIHFVMLRAYAPLAESSLKRKLERKFKDSV